MSLKCLSSPLRLAISRGASIWNTRYYSYEGEVLIQRSDGNIAITLFGGYSLSGLSRFEMVCLACSVLFGWPVLLILLIFGLNLFDNFKEVPTVMNECVAEACLEVGTSLVQ